MKKQALIIGIVLMTTLVAFAQPSRDGARPERNQESRMDRMAQKLELSEDQKTQFEQAKISNYKVTKPLRNQLAEKKAALKTLTTAEKVNQGQVNQTIDEIGDLQTAMLKAKVNHQIAMRAMLTDKQKMLFDQMHTRKGQGKKQKCDEPRRG